MPEKKGCCCGLRHTVGGMPENERYYSGLRPTAAGTPVLTGNRMINKQCKYVHRKTRATLVDVEEKRMQ